ncbi:site-specific DNA-methyltransferase [Mycolicibacterium sp. jd]|uniref:site-specific DNA-methyltransferase n=1 Tax=unclassified Mycolicibacterium TaxID=2636767 RepID=UPI00351B3CF3
MELEDLELLSKDELIEVIGRLQGEAEPGVKLTFPGKATARRITRRVRPRVQRTIAKYGAGPDEERAKNVLIEGDNLQALTTLYKERGNVDLILTDPPYNTGGDWRYNDKWDDDPNDPGIGDVVREDDRARHTKWMKFMYPRLLLMKQMLKPSGVLAICIDHRELFHLGQLLDELFGAANRLAIINWEKASAPRNDKRHVASATEYVLVYAKDAERAATGALPRSEASLGRYANPDGDPRGNWREHDLTARTPSPKDQYGIQSPFDGTIHYPAGHRSWAHPKRNIKRWVEEWGVEYAETDIGDGRPPALMVKGGKALPFAGNGERPRTRPGSVPRAASKAANKVLERGNWPFVWWGLTGTGGPRPKKYLEAVRKGIVPTTYWASDDYEEPLGLGSTSWDWEQSGLSQTGIKELSARVGNDHGFETVKPLQLMAKIIQIWCQPDGIVLDPFAGSGTTGEAVLLLNASSEAARRFILVEQGRPERGDSYAKTLTADRLRRVVSGDWANGNGVALGGGFEFRSLTKQVDAPALLAMEREEMVDTVIASYFDASRRRGSNLIRVHDSTYAYLVAHNADDEGFYLVWGGIGQNTDLTEDVYEACVAEGQKAELKPVYHIYSRFNLFTTSGVHWYQIPDRILADFGLDVRTESYTDEEQ